MSPAWWGTIASFKSGLIRVLHPLRNEIIYEFNEILAQWSSTYASVRYGKDIVACHLHVHYAPHCIWKLSRGLQGPCPSKMAG